MKTIRVPGFFSDTNEIAWKEVEILYENNGWAVTPTTQFHDPDRYPYTISHMQSGCGACKLDDMEFAIDLCNKLPPTAAIFVEKKRTIAGSTLQITEAWEVLFPCLLDGTVHQLRLPNHLEGKLQYSWETAK